MMNGCEAVPCSAAAARPRLPRRILIYSYDSFGLGHFRRCMLIAQALADSDEAVEVVVITGCPVAAQFPVLPQVRIVPVPPVVKGPDGSYRPLDPACTAPVVLQRRAKRIARIAAEFAPHLFIVDKEPLGLLGELAATLAALSRRGTRIVLGVRDILDHPTLLLREWARKHSLGALARYYSDVWIYGIPEFWNPLHGLALPTSIRGRVYYTGYLHRRLPASPETDRGELARGRLLVTVGGGGDGAAMVEQIVAAYETHPDIPLGAVFVLGPLMPDPLRRELTRRARRLENAMVVPFTTDLEQLMARAAGIVAMCGYNTFCEILSFGQRALLVPRRAPRLEQHIRATRAEHFGLARMIEDRQPNRSERLVRALKSLADQAPPRLSTLPGFFDGLQNVVRLAQAGLGLARTNMAGGDA